MPPAEPATRPRLTADDQQRVRTRFELCTDRVKRIPLANEDLTFHPILQQAGARLGDRLASLLCQTPIHVFEVLFSSLGVDLVGELLQIGILDVENRDGAVQCTRQSARLSDRSPGMVFAVNSKKNRPVRRLFEQRFASHP